MIASTIVAPDVSRAWLAAITYVREQARDKAVFHLVVQIENIVAEDRRIRTMANQFLDAWAAAKPDAAVVPIITVRNTIFPRDDVRLARGDPDKLVEGYRGSYDLTKKFHGNSGGTYFGRIVESRVDRKGREYNQLTDTIRKLRDRGNATRTEIDMSLEYEADDAADPVVGIYAAPLDRKKTMGFPCLSHIACQRDGDHLHTFAFYRNQDLGRKAYGNYWGLGQLTAYIAEQAGLEPGVLTVAAGRAYYDGPVKLLDQQLASLRQPV